MVKTRRENRTGQRGRSQAITEPQTVVSLFEKYWQLFRGPELMREYRFHPPRRYPFDYAHVASKVAIECEGGVMIRGWHQSIQRYLTDCEKYSLAALDGWCVVRLTIKSLEDDPAFWIQAIIKAIEERG